MKPKDPETISEAMIACLNVVEQARSAHTLAAYRNGLARFKAVLFDNGLDPDQAPPAALSEEVVAWLIQDLRGLAPASERLYLTAVTYFYTYLAAENLAAINLPRLRERIRVRARRPGLRLPEFPNEAIETLITKITEITSFAVKNEEERLRNLRDRAFLLTLADTGLRVHEACALRRGDVDWNEYRAVVTGKGDQQAVVRFSSRSIAALRDYLRARAVIDGASGRPLSSLPLFIRHDKGAGKEIRPLITNSGRNIVRDRVRQFLGEDAVGTITPHSFRHYFVTCVLQASGNLKLAQELARHKSISVTQRYAHLSNAELDKGYYQAIERRADEGNGGGGV